MADAESVISTAFSRRRTCHSVADTVEFFIKGNRFQNTASKLFGIVDLPGKGGVKNGVATGWKRCNKITLDQVRAVQFA